MKARIMSTRAKDISGERRLQALRRARAAHSAAESPLSRRKGMHSAYRLRQSRANTTYTITRFLAALEARLGRWAFNMVRVRDLLTCIPVEGSSYVPVDAVANARNLLLARSVKTGAD